MEIEVYDIDTSGLEAALRELSVLLRKDYGTIIRERARLVAVSLAYQTQPFGDGEEARFLGENRVRSDLRKVYRSPVDTYFELRKAARVKGKQTPEGVAKAFSAAMFSRDYDRARAILRGSGIVPRELESWDKGALHQQKRNRRGRVGSSRPVAVTNGRSLEAYKKQLLRRVGMAKGGWAQCTRSLGGARGIPQWVKRHKGNLGSVVDQHSNFNHPHVILRNHVRHIRGALTPAQIDRALEYQLGQMLTRIERIHAGNFRRVGLAA